MTYKLIQYNREKYKSYSFKIEYDSTFQPVVEEKPKPVEVMPEKSEKPLKEELSWEDKEEKIGEEIKVENETEPGSRKFMWRQFTLHMIKCALHQVLRLSILVYCTKSEN